MGSGEGEINLGFDPGSMQSLNRLSRAESKSPTAAAAQKAMHNDEGLVSPYASIPGASNSAHQNEQATQHNDGYEMPIELIQYYQDTQRRQAIKPQQRKTKMRKPGGLLDSWFNRVCLFLIMCFSIAAIVLVILLMLGKVGVDSCDSSCDVSGPSSLAQTSDQPEAVIELSPLEEMTQKLVSNYNEMLKQVESNEVQLEEINKTFVTSRNESRDRLSELNFTAQQSSGLMFLALSRLNSSLAAKVKRNESELTKEAEDLQADIYIVNSTVGALLKAKLDEPGPQGPRGRNGSQGPQGPTGAPGEMGPEGHNGTQGEEGPTGVVGERGPDGANGTQGGPGIMGLKGDKGYNGSVGDQGPVGPQGVQGIGNFSWCEHNTESNPNSIQVVDTNEHKMFWVQCGSSLGQDYEANLNVALPGGFKQYTCLCKGDPSNPPSTPCTLQYWKCPIFAP